MTHDFTIQITQEHADAFLRSLFPCGEMSLLANHTRSFLEGMCGSVPTSLRWHTDFSEHEVQNAKRLSAVLHEIANYIEQGRKK